MKEFIKKLDFYIESYDVEKRLYKRGKKWRKKGYLKKNNLWKFACGNHAVLKKDMIPTMQLL